MRTAIGIVIGIIVIIGAIIVLDRSLPIKQSFISSKKFTATLTAEETTFDFGEISMAAGKIDHSFKIKNNSTEPSTIKKVYSSCMCTSVKLVTTEDSFGPFGMPGHGAIPAINAQLAPNEEALVVAIFDPAAHGPSGVGRIERKVFVEEDGIEPMELNFSATVTP